ncbi:hypothetical protein C8N24_0319 [Solirubrobacter pauli]|uniref:Uncharacterized protein n=1 Tax=Solirubrobacter pauli TaxID=166793 RepID=A0A660LBV6_9ACTN|nr:FAM221A/B family protein [Solirubrobacter pauli]RKQ90514.1 hypothetical protein C8N24_0319 [Solirubrobacter pauli]
MNEPVVITTARVTEPKAVCACEHHLSKHKVRRGTDRRYVVPCNVKGCACVEYRDRRAPAP